MLVPVLGFLYLYFIKFARPGEVATAAEIKDQKLHTVALKGDTLCSDGSAYEIYVRKGSSENMLIFFAGGGACWDGLSSSKPITLMSIFDGIPKN